MVIKIQELLDYMAARRNKEIEANRQGVSIVPARKPKAEANPQGGSMVPARVQEREASHQGGSVVLSMVRARDLVITHSDKPQRWTWSTINEAPK